MTGRLVDMWKFWTLLLAFATLTAPAAAAAWVAGPDLEPSTAWDVPPYTWTDAPGATGDRVYFSGHLTFWPAPSTPSAAAGAPVPASAAFAYAEAYLGYWRDCNGDGAIGELLTGRETYLALEGPIDTELCPVHSNYFDGIEVKEFLWIGPGAYDAEGFTAAALAPLSPRGDPRDVADAGARVWADWGPPAVDPLQGVRLWPLPRGTLEDTDGHFAYLDQLLVNTLSTNEHTRGWWPTTPDGAHNPASPVPNVDDPVTQAVRDRYNASDDSEAGPAFAEPWSWGTRTNPDCELRADQGVSTVRTDGSLYPTIDHAYRSLATDCSRNPADKFPIYPNLESGYELGKKVQTDWSFFFFPATRFNPSDTSGLVDAQLCTGLERYESVVDGCNGGWFAREHFVMTPAPYAGGSAAQDVTITFYADTRVADGHELPPGSRDAFTYGFEQCGDGVSQAWDCDPANWEEAMGGLGTEWKVTVGHPYELRDVDVFSALLPVS